MHLGVQVLRRSAYVQVELVGIVELYVELFGNLAVVDLDPQVGPIVADQLTDGESHRPQYGLGGNEHVEREWLAAWSLAPPVPVTIGHAHRIEHLLRPFGVVVGVRASPRRIIEGRSRMHRELLWDCQPLEDELVYFFPVDRQREGLAEALVTQAQATSPDRGDSD